VSRTYKPKPASHARGNFLGILCTRAPFRLLPIRAPRQAVLRTSSWLAPSRITNRPCDLPVETTRDASNRLLPPNRTTCTRTSCIPGSLSPLSQRGRPAETKAPRGITGGPNVSRRSKDRFGGSSINTRPRALLPHGLETRAWAFSSHGADAIEPLTPLSRAPFNLTPHPASRVLQSGRTSFFGEGSYGSEDAETAKTTVHAFS